MNPCQKLPREITLDLTSRTSQLRTSSVDMLLLILRISQLVVVLTLLHRSLFLTTLVKFAMVIRLFWIATLLTSLANLTKLRRRLIDVLEKLLKQTRSRSNLEMLVSWSLFRASQCALRLFQIFHLLVVLLFEIRQTVAVGVIKSVTPKDV